MLGGFLCKLPFWARALEVAMILTCSVGACWCIFQWLWNSFSHSCHTLGAGICWPENNNLTLNYLLLLFVCWYTNRRHIQPAGTDPFRPFIKGGKLCFHDLALDFVQLRFSPWASWAYGSQGNNPLTAMKWNEISVYTYLSSNYHGQLALRLPVDTAKCRRRTKLQHVHLGHPEDHLRLKEVACVHAANLTTSTHTNLISIVINMQMSLIVNPRILNFNRNSRHSTWPLATTISTMSFHSGAAFQLPIRDSRFHRFDHVADSCLALHGFDVPQCRRCKSQSKTHQLIGQNHFEVHMPVPGW